MPRRALVIGVANYALPLGNLPSAIGDAEKVAAALTRFGRFETEILRDPRSELLREVVFNFLHSLGERDAGLLYFAGHGHIVRDKAHILGRDPTATGLRLDHVYADVGNGTRLLVVLDCCHAGAALSKDNTEPARNENILVLGACRAHETIPEVPEGGHLTEQLVRVLAGEQVHVLNGFSNASMAATAASKNGQIAWVGGKGWPGDFTELLNPNGTASSALLAADDVASSGGIDALAAYRQSVLDTVRVPDAPWTRPDSLLDTAEIERLIVTLSLRARSPDEALRDLPGSDRSWRLRDLVDPDAHVASWATGRWLVQGGPGAGKSTMLRRLARELSAPDSGWLPVWAPLPWAAAPSAENLLQRVAAPCRELAPGLAKLLEVEARAGRVVLLCDGLDELPAGESRKLALERLKRWAAEWPGPIIVAGRHHGVSLDGPFLPVDVQPLGPEQQLQLVRERLGGGPAPPGYTEARTFLNAHRDRLGELAGNPFYLTLLALVFASGEQPGATPARMYLKVIDILLRGKHRHEPDGRPAPGVRNPKRTLDALTHLALRMTEEAPDEGSADEADEDDLVEWLDRTPACQSQTPLELLNDIASKAGFLVREAPDAGRWRFLHRAFREVLCAQALVDQLDGDADALAARAATLTSKEHLPLWANPWALAAGLLDDANPLLTTLLDANEPLAVDALLNAFTVSRETFVAFLVRPLPNGHKELEARRRVYLAAADKLPDAKTVLALDAELVAHRLEPEERWFLDELCDAVKARWPHVDVEAARRSIYANLPEPPADLIPWSEVIPAGRFWMGSPEGVGRDDEHPRHQVELTRSYRLGTAPVTISQWWVFDPEHEPYAWKNVPEDELPDHPVVNVSWYAAQAYCRWLSHSWGFEVRLPTEAEWERACRGPNGEDEANHDRWWFGDSESQLAKHAWYGENSHFRTHAVGTTPGGAGPRGLHDMHGNVWEWCRDWFSNDSYARTEAGGGNVDPKGPPGDVRRVLRGGSYGDGASRCRSAFRVHWLPAGCYLDRGFRVLLPAAPGN